MTPEWTPARARRVFEELERSSSARRIRRRVAVGVLATAAAVAGTLWRVDPPAPSVAPALETLANAPATAVQSTRSPMALNFRDGTHVLPHDATSEVMIAAAGPRETQIQLRRGGARFDVTPNPDRRFTVDAGLVTVEVLGTEFDCIRAGDRVTVDVLRGRVSVSWPGGSKILGKGETGVFPPDVQATSDDDVHDPAPSQTPDAIGSAPPPSRTPRDVETLLREADQARKLGRTRAALGILRRVVREHGRDSRAPLAAFSIGRIELERKNYRTAARFFAKVRSMGKTPLAEHALAREAEAWAASGMRERAQDRAREYLRLHPNGPRATEVRRLLEPGTGD